MATETVALARTAYKAFTDEEFLSNPPTFSASDVLDVLKGAHRVSASSEWKPTAPHEQTPMFVIDSLQAQGYTPPLNSPTAMPYWQTVAPENDSLQEYYRERIKLLTAHRRWTWVIDVAPPTAVATDEALTPQDALRASLTNRLWAAFEAEPLEDGVSHPAEDAITEALDELGTPRALECFRDISLDMDNPAFAASVLRCLGRQADLGTGEWRIGLVRVALGSDDAEVRDAAAQAAESWGDFGMLAALEAHDEPTAWLKDYIDAIVDDMRA